MPGHQFLHILGDTEAAQYEDILSLSPILGINQSPTGWNFGEGTGWTVSSGWTMAGGVATATAAVNDCTCLFSYLPSIPSGQQVRITYRISSYTGGTFRPYLRTGVGGAAPFGTTVSAAGLYQETLTATDTVTRFGMDALSSFTGVLDLIDIRIV